MSRAGSLRPGGRDNKHQTGVAAPRHIATRRMCRHMSRPGANGCNLPRHLVAGSRMPWREHCNVRVRAATHRNLPHMPTYVPARSDMPQPAATPRGRQQGAVPQTSGWLDIFALRTCGKWQHARGDVSHSAISISARDRTVGKKSKGLRDRNSPSCTLSQNGYGADRWFHVASVVTTQLRCQVPWRGDHGRAPRWTQSGAECRPAAELGLRFAPGRPTPLRPRP